MSGNGEGSPTRLKEWRTGWPVVLAAGFGLGTTALYFYSLGLMIAPLNKAFGWTQAQITSGPIIISIFYFLLSARVGALVDRIGVRQVAIPGYTAFCIALAALGLAGPSIWSWYGLWAVLALVFTATAPSLWAMAIVGHFDRARAFALSIALCSTGVMGALTPIIQAWAIDHGGWRLSYFMLGGIMLVLGLPVLWMCLPRHPTAAARAQAAAAPPPPDLPGPTFREALRGPRFWMIAATSLLIGASIGALMVHLPSIGLAKRMTVAQVAGFSSLIGITAIGGRLLSGALMDRISSRTVGAVVFILPAISCLLLASTITPASMAGAAVLIGVVAGGDYNVLAMLTSRYLGMRSYGATFGQIAAAFNIGVGAGPAVVGAVHDRIHDYGPLLIGLAILFVLVGLLTLSLGREPEWREFPAA